jgi:F-type H+-transporting ATPase subunit b
VTKTLTERRENILKSLSDADERFAEAQAKVALAKAEIENAKSKARKIQLFSITMAEQGVKAILQNAHQEINRLEDSKKITIQLEEKKLVSEVYERVVRLVITQAKKIIQQRLNLTPQFHLRLVEDRTLLLGTSKLSVQSKKSLASISSFYF